MAITIENFGFERPRLIAKKILPKSRVVGAGAVVRRSIGGDEFKSLDPFLLLDEFEVSPPCGFPDHGHRGFETLTYMLQGGLSHQDFAGNEGTIHVGDVQWMSAGRGIVHSEMPVGEGITSGVQLWINLPSKDKMMEPRYEEVMSEKIPISEKDGVEVKVIAGESMGIEYPRFTKTPIMYLFFTLKPNTQYHQTISKTWNAFVYIIEGEGVFGIPDSQPNEAHHLLVLSNDGDGLSVWNKSSKQLKFILVGGKPLNEPVVHQGPFVMNTQDEVNKTIQDYKYGNNGFENAKHWKSKW